MEYPKMGVVYDAQADSFILRLRSGFEAKARRMTEYMKAGLILPGQASVIAISGAMLPNPIGEGPVPRILKAVLGVGNLILDIDRSTHQAVDHAVEHRDEVRKKSGTVISTAPFLDPAYEHVSAVVYSPYNWVTHPENPGADLTLVHNEKATVKLPHGWLQNGDEYWREGDQLLSATHRRLIAA
jgi:hypothetical protein